MVNLQCTMGCRRAFPGISFTWTITWLAGEPGSGTPGAPVECISGPNCLAGLGHSKPNWGTGAAARAVPWFFQFLMPAPQVAVQGDSGTDALCVALIQLLVEPLPRPSSLSGPRW